MAKEGISFKIEGMKEVQDILKQLPDSVNNKIALQIHREAAKIVKEELEKRAPTADDDSILDAITIAKGQQPTDILIGFKKSGYKARWFEYGTKSRSTDSGANRGSMGRTQFVSHSHDAAIPRMIQYLQNNYLKVVSKTLKKLARKLYT